MDFPACTPASLPPMVYVLDDDDDIRDVMAAHLESVGLPFRIYHKPAEFLAAIEPHARGCLVMDLRMPGMNGLEVLTELRQRGIELPVIFMSGFAEVPSVVTAIKNGAVDFLQKPFSFQHLLQLVQQCLRQAEAPPAPISLPAAARTRLTQREQDVLALLLQGRMNKQIAADLDISIRTVETHRAHIMEKFGAQTVADLVIKACNGG